MLSTRRHAVLPVVQKSNADKSTAYPENVGHFMVNAKHPVKLQSSLVWHMDVWRNSKPFQMGRESEIVFFTREVLPYNA